MDALGDLVTPDRLREYAGKLMTDRNSSYPTGPEGRMLIAADRIEELEGENGRLRAELERAHDARIEAQNPGIDMEQVRADRAERRAG